MVRKGKKQGKRPINLITHTHPKLPASEQYRLIRSNLLFSSVDHEVHSIVITSPEPSDGKTTTAANLAIVMAQQEKNTLLVDGDLRKPSIHHTFNVSNIKGLTTILTKKASLESALVKTNIPYLDFLPGGPIPPNPSELLASKSMDTLLDELKRKYEYIIFDTSPILAVTDPQILANKCDGVVLIVSNRRTLKNHARKAKELLEKANGQLLGVVMNGVDTENNEYYYQ